MSRLPRFFSSVLPGETGALVELSGEEASHATKVLRLEEGGEVEVFDGKGGAGTFRIERASRRGLALSLLRRTDEDREALCAVTLAFAPPRPKRTLALIEKATELGCARFVPLETERTRAPLGEKALDRLRRRALEACKQCGRNRVPDFAASLSLEALLREERSRADLALLPDTRGARALSEVLKEARKPVKSALFLVGPEGGFAEGERVLLREGGFLPVIFGRATLRVETAAIAVLTCLRYELG